MARRRTAGLRAAAGPVARPLVPLYVAVCAFAAAVSLGLALVRDGAGPIDGPPLLDLEAPLKRAVAEVEAAPFEVAPVDDEDPPSAREEPVVLVLRAQPAGAPSPGPIAPPLAHQPPAEPAATESRPEQPTSKPPPPAVSIAPPAAETPSDLPGRDGGPNAAAVPEAAPSSPPQVDAGGDEDRSDPGSVPAPAPSPNDADDKDDSRSGGNRGKEAGGKGKEGGGKKGSGSPPGVKESGNDKKGDGRGEGKDTPSKQNGERD